MENFHEVYEKDLAGLTSLALLAKNVPETSLPVAHIRKQFPELVRVVRGYQELSLLARSRHAAAMIPHLRWPIRATSKCGHPVKVSLRIPTVHGGPRSVAPLDGIVPAADRRGQPVR